jgi:hypothetical protein
MIRRSRAQRRSRCHFVPPAMRLRSRHDTPKRQHQTSGVVSSNAAGHYRDPVLPGCSLPRMRHSWKRARDRRLRPAAARLKAARIPRPPVSVTCEDVTIGNPHPQCHELAARKLGVNVKECRAVEAAAAGILAARAAGARVIAISETHIHPFETTWITIPAYEGWSHTQTPMVYIRVSARLQILCIDVGCGDLLAPGRYSGATLARHRTHSLQLNGMPTPRHALRTRSSSTAVAVR